jgi:hypothetical protein
VPANRIIGSRRPNRFSLANTKSERMLQAIGTGDKDVIVGSPDFPDILDGSSGGGDSFVVGNGNTGLAKNLNPGDGDAVKQTSSTTNENDAAILSTYGNVTEYIYISTSRERTPGIIDLSPTPTGYNSNSELSGAGKILVVAAQMSPNPMDCLSNALTALPPASSNLISLATGSLTGTLLPQIAAQTLRLFPITAQAASGILMPGAYAPSDKQIACQTIAHCVGSTIPSFKGVPIVKGLQINGSTADRLILDLEQYSAAPLSSKRLPLGQQLKRNSPVPIWVVSSVSVGSAAQDSAYSNEEGLPQSLAPTRDYSLFYFEKNGLLVYSSQGEPLASRVNPGRIIAQLLDASGRPLVLPTTGQSPIHPARFILFEPNAPRALTCPAATSRSC